MPSLTNIWYRNWQSKLQRAAFTSLRNTKVLCAFNALIDQTVYYDQRFFIPLFKHFEADRHSILRHSNRNLQRIDSPQLLIAGLIHGFRTGKALHLPTNSALIDWLEKLFPRFQTSIGGQAGIIANQIALLGGQSILYTSHLSPKLARLFSPRVKFPVANRHLEFVSVSHAAKKTEQTRTNWIFEFKKGDVIQFGGTVFVAPRSNRLILSSPQDHPALFEPNLVHQLPILGERINAGIVSGYHSLQPLYADGSTYEYYLSIEELYLKMLKAHKNVPLHIEYVSTPHKDVDKMIYEHIAKHVDSLGLNEIEIVELSEKLGFGKQAREIAKSENVVTIHAAAEKIMDVLELKRVHVHNLGYHLILLKKPVDIGHQHKAVNAALFGSLAATSRAVKGREITRGEVQDALSISASETALNQMARFCSHNSLSRTRSEHSILSGIFDMGNHVALIVPGQVASLTRKTVGLGDVASSCAFLAGL